MFSTSYSTPNLDTTQNLENISITVVDGVYTFTCYRALDTGDSEDFAIELDKEFPIIWAE